jgi:cell division protein FtsB
MVYTEKRSSFWLTLVATLTLAYFAVLPVHGAETVNINRADVDTLASQLVGVVPQLEKRIV